MVRFLIFPPATLDTHNSPTSSLSPPYRTTRTGSRVGVPELVAAVSNAGGLGILTALTQPNPEALREAIKRTRKLTDKNFGVNITLLPSINPPDYEGYARAAVEEGIKIFETAGNNRAFLRSLWILPSSGRALMCGVAGPLIKFFKQNGCIVIHKCGCSSSMYSSRTGGYNHF